MMKIFLVFILLLVSNKSIADELSNFGVLKSLTNKDADFLYFKPKVSNRIIIDLNYDNNYQSSDRRNEFQESSGKIRYFNNINFNNYFALNSYVKVQKIDNNNEIHKRSLSNSGGDRAFENMGSYIEEINLNYKYKNNNLIIGKFNLDFGSAWRWDRGLWIHNVAEEYKQTEKIGIADFIKIGNSKKTGQYNFGYSLFTNDRKNFDNSIMANRDSAHKSDATVGDTRSLKSYNIFLEVNFNFSKKEKLNYHFSYINLAINKRNAPSNRNSDQHGLTAGMNYKFPISDNFELDGILEYADIKNFAGSKNHDQKYYSFNLINRFYNNYNILVGNSMVKNFNNPNNLLKRNLSEISLGYEFDKSNFFDNLTMQLGWKIERIDFVSTVLKQNSYGFLARYTKSF